MGGSGGGSSSFVILLMLLLIFGAGYIYAESHAINLEKQEAVAALREMEKANAAIQANLTGLRGELQAASAAKQQAEAALAAEQAARAQAETTLAEALAGKTSAEAALSAASAEKTRVETALSAALAEKAQLEAALAAAGGAESERVALAEQNKTLLEQVAQQQARILELEQHAEAQPEFLIPVTNDSGEAAEQPAGDGFDYGLLPWLGAGLVGWLLAGGLALRSARSAKARRLALEGPALENGQVLVAMTRAEARRYAQAARARRN